MALILALAVFFVASGYWQCRRVFHQEFAIRIRRDRVAGTNARGDAGSGVVAGSCRAATACDGRRAIAPGDP